MPYSNPNKKFKLSPQAVTPSTTPQVVPLSTPSDLHTEDQSLSGEQKTNEQIISSTEPSLFSESNMRSDFVAAYPELDLVCERLQFGWDLTVGAWSYNLDWALLELARAAKPPPPALTRDWSELAINELIDDLIQIHHRPLRNELRRIGILLRNVNHHHEELHSLNLIDAFASLAINFMLHVNHEEKVLFPFCIAVEKASRQLRIHSFDNEVTAALRMMSTGHTDSATELRHLHVTVLAALEKTTDPDLTLISTGLIAMMTDLTLHEYKEANILLPAIVFAEEQVRTKAENCNFIRLSSVHETR